MQSKVSRSGFYLHYVDKYEPVVNYQKANMEKRAKGAVIFEKAMYPDKRTFIKNAIQFLHEEGQVLSLLLSKNGSTKIQGKVKVMLGENAKRNILPHVTLPINTEITEKYLTAFMSSAILGVIQEWIDTGQNETPEEVINELMQVFSINFV